MRLEGLVGTPPSRLLVAASALLALALPGAAQQPLAPRTMTRDVDTVVIPGRTVGRVITGAQISRIRVYAGRGGMPIPILFQVDEKNAAGGYCYDQGPTDLRIRDEQGGVLDDNDELVVLSREAGERLRPDIYPAIAGHTALQELELKDPVGGGTAWIYVARFDGPLVPPKVQRRLVDLTSVVHDEEDRTWTWKGERFLFNNDRSRKNAVRATFATFFEPGATQPQRGVNLIDSTIVRAVVSFMWVEVVRQSNDIKVELGSYINGPIRAIAQNRLQVYLALGMWASAPDSYVMLWPNKVSMPTNARCPVNLDQSGESSYTLCMDMSKRTRGLKFYNSRNATPVDVDGRASAGERGLDMGWPDWNCMFGPEGAVISRFIVPPAMQRATNRLVYIDDENFRREEDVEGIEFEPGAIGTNGYYVDMRGLQEGIYPGDYVMWYAPAPFGPGDERKYLDEWDRPIVVTATAP